MGISWVKRQLNNFRAFLDRHLDPSEQLAQTSVGVIMVLTWPRSMPDRPSLRTLGGQMQVVPASRDDDGDADGDDDGPTTPLQYMRVALGCNVVWGVITGMMNLMTSIYDRSRPVRLQRDVRDADDDAEAQQIVQQELDADLAVITTKEARALLFEHILDRLDKTAVPRSSLQWRDLVSGVDHLVSRRR